MVEETKSDLVTQFTLTGHSDTFNIQAVLDSIKESTKEALLEVRPETMVSSAEEKLASMKDFRKEVSESLTPILEQL